MKNTKRMIALLLSLLMLAALCACGKTQPEPTPAESTEPTEAAESAEPTESADAEPTAPAAAPEMADGERFETVIAIEGMEETVNYEHLRNETAGFSMDYDYESFVRRSEPDRERIIWGYDDPENPENYIEVAYSAEDAETVARAVSETLSKDYALHQDELALDRAGKCIHIDASATVDGSHTADVLQAVYIIPAPDGCRVATIRYIPEGSDGFGKRLSLMVNTITVMEANRA